VAIHCWLGGGAAWAIPNRLDAGLANGRRVLAAWIKARRRPAAAKA